MNSLKKVLYILITLAICLFLRLGDIFVGFTPVFLLLLFFRFDGNIVWEIPLAVLFCNVLEIAFADEMKFLIYTQILVATALISAVNPRKLTVLFLITVFALIFKNTYSVASLWAAIWYAGHTALLYFITKNPVLQDYKK